MDTIKNLTRSVLTETREPSTPEPQVNIQNWAKWAEFNLCGDGGLARSVEAMARFCIALKNDEEPRWLSILGTTGNGKTHLAKRAWKYGHGKLNWSKTEWIPRFIYWPDFVDKLRSGDAYELYESMKKWPVLALDDIGAERDNTGFASEKLNTLLGCRIGQWTILTSNLGLDQLEAIDRRISSRIVRGKNIWMETNAEDYALR